MTLAESKCLSRYNRTARTPRTAQKHAFPKKIKEYISAG